MPTPGQPPTSPPPPPPYQSAAPPYQPAPPQYQPAPPPPYAGAPGQPYQPYGVPGGGFQPPKRTSGLAIASMVLGIVGVPMFVLVIPSLLALIFGIVSLRQISDRPQQLGGKGMAVAGVILGGLMLGILILALVASGGSFSYEVD